MQAGSSLWNFYILHCLAGSLGKSRKKKVFSDVEYLHHLSFIYSEVIFELIKEMKLHLTVENYVQIFLRHTKNLII